VQSYKQLRVWQISHANTLDVYRVTRRFPDDEKYGITSQMRRAASSIPANIAEGSGLPSDAAFARHLHIAHGSARELEYLTLLAAELGYVRSDDTARLEEHQTHVRRMLIGLLRRMGRFRSALRQR